METRNPIAKALRIDELRQRVLPDKRHKAAEEEAKRELDVGQNQ